MTECDVFFLAYAKLAASFPHDGMICFEMMRVRCALCTSSLAMIEKQFMPLIACMAILSFVFPPRKMAQPDWVCAEPSAASARMGERIYCGLNYMSVASSTDDDDAVNELMYSTYLVCLCAP